MANEFYNRGATFNPDELADGDAIEAEFDAVARGFDTIENLVNANKAGYPTQTFHVAPAELDTHAVPKAQMDAALSFKLDTVNYNASDILTKLKTVDGVNSGLDSDTLDGYEGERYALAAAGNLVAGANWDTFTRHGTYKVNGTNAGLLGAPPCTYGYGILTIEVSEVGGERRVQQLYYPHNKEMDKFFYHRMFNQSLWTSWSKVWWGDAPYAKSNILGTVDQSSGVPIGAVIERGSNANGAYTKFADGTLICTSSGLLTIVDATLYGDFDGNWAATFLGTPSISAAVHEVYFGNARFSMSLRQVFADDVKYRVTMATSYGETLTYKVCVMAIGRWF